MFDKRFDDALRDLVSEDAFYSLVFIRARGPHPSKTYLVEGWGMQAKVLQETIREGAPGLKAVEGLAISLGLYPVRESQNGTLQWHVPKFSLTIHDDGGNLASGLIQKLRAEGVPCKVVTAECFAVFRDGKPFEIPEKAARFQSSHPEARTMSWICDAVGHSGRGLPLPGNNHYLVPVAA